MNDAKRWMPLWIGDYLADTMQLSPEQHGVYLLFLMHQWRCGGLPDDPEELCRIAGSKPTRYASTVRVVLEKYFKLDEQKRWVNSRCRDEYDRAMANRAKAQAKASKAAILRWKPKSVPTGE